eukprot:9178632-Alexandrium_andersonii.AAC.1
MSPKTAFLCRCPMRNAECQSIAMGKFGTASARFIRCAAHLAFKLVGPLVCSDVCLSERASESD